MVPGTRCTWCAGRGAPPVADFPFLSPGSAGYYNQADAFQGQWFYVQDQEQDFIFGKPGGVGKKTSKPSMSVMSRQIGC